MRPSGCSRCGSPWQPSQTQVGASGNAIMAALFSWAKESATAALGAARFEAEFQRGTRYTREAAISLALRWSGNTAKEAPRSALSGPLGKREADVARLVADGLSRSERVCSSPRARLRTVSATGGS